MNKATAAVIAALALLPSAIHGDGIALCDQGMVFSGSSSGGDAALARIGLCLVPQGSPCIHDAEGYLDFEAAFSPQVNWIKIVQSMLYGFVLNTNGTLRLSLDRPGVGSVTIGAPPLLCGWLYDTASIHPCSGGVQEMCYACGRRHSLDEDHNCSHDAGCLARTSYLRPCTCGPLLVRINWDDDSCNLSEDRFAQSPCDGDDEIEHYRALGEAMSCCCNCPEIVSNTISVAGLEATSELRLWNGTQPAPGTAGAFGIEAIEASSGIGSAQICYELRDETDDRLVRTITRRVTAANMEIRPDYNDDGAVDLFDLPFRNAAGTPWQVRVRDEPYAFSIVSEAPYDSTLSVCAMPIGGITPIVRTELDGGVALQAGTWTTNSAFASANGMRILYIDTSQGPGDMDISGSLAFGSVHAPINDVLRIRAVDANVREKWTTTNDLSRILYDFSDVTGFIWWTISDGEYNVISSGSSASFCPPALPPGDYTVEVYFSDIVEDGTAGYTSSAALHVIDVRLARLFETANEANRIFNPTRKDDTTGNTNAETEVVNAGTPFEERYAVPRNYLYTVGDPVTGNFNVSARFDATGAEGCTNYYCAFYQPGGQKVPGTETNVDLSAQATAFSLPAPTGAIDAVWELRGGLDTNGNATLDNDEATPFAIYTNSANVVKYACIKGITRGTYATDDSIIESWATGMLVNFGLPVGRSFLSIFFNGGVTAVPNIWRPTQDSQVMTLDAFANCAGFSEWLTHNSGAVFDSDGIAEISKYTWGPETQMSKFFARCAPFSPWEERTSYRYEGNMTIPYTYYLPTTTGHKLLNYFTTVIKPIAESRLASAMDGDTAVFSSATGWDDLPLVTNIFTSLSPPSIEGATVTVGAIGNYGGIMAAVQAGALTAVTGGAQLDNLDAFFSIGKGRVIDPSYEIVAVKRIPAIGDPSVELKEIAFTCIICDLYDFNYEDSDLSSVAATLQIGFDHALRTHGKIYRHEVQIETVYRNPFLY